ncbi:MAG: bestrophin family ion channel [Cyanobacteria bacterium J06636_16]
MDRRPWFRTLFQLRGSVIPAVLPRTLLCAGFGLLISALYTFGVPVAISTLGSLVPSIVLGLLLVFRTNTAYERFWEGRKQWGALVNTSRNLARQIWVAIQETEEKDRSTKIRHLRLIVAFAIAMKLHLRGESLDAELAEVVTPAQFTKLQGMHNPPLEVAFWLADYLQTRCDRGQLNAYQLAAMLSLVDRMVDTLGSCERILKTPIPLAYSIHLKQLLLLYCLALPFQMVDTLHGWTALMTGLISFAVFGIEAIGIEIENPFGHDPNDLPLDAICQTMHCNIEDLITLTPGNCRWLEEVGTKALSEEL